MSGAALHHLNLRVAWHDDRWNGHVCRAPSRNSYCLDLDRIRAERDDAAEDKLSGKPFWELKDWQFPPCQADSGAFMNASRPHLINKNCLYAPMNHVNKKC